MLYGQGECLLLSVKPEELVKILRAQAGSTALISITINGAKAKSNRTALLRDYQVDPITGEVLHADFFEVAMDKPIRVKVPIHLTGGQPLGLKEGGVLHQALRELHVECLPSALPDFIAVDASHLKINEGIHLKDIPKTEGLRFLDDPDHMVVSVAAPMTDAKLESLLTTGAAWRRSGQRTGSGCRRARERPKGPPGRRAGQARRCQSRGRRRRRRGAAAR